MLTSGQPVRETLVSAVSGRPRKACGHCKSQKVRCSGDRPICKRCSRLKHTCVYSTGQPQSPKQPHVRSSTATSESVFGANKIAVTGLNETPRVQGAPSLAPSGPDYLGIPVSLIPELIEVFYSHSYNASLLLHKELFLKGLAEGTFTGHVLLSVCAIASNFYRDAQGNTSLSDHGFGTEWAERASKLVFQDVESPTEDNVVTFLNLTLFWYGQGSWRRTFIHNGNAVQTAYLLGLGKERKGEVDSFQAESRRRRYWACYLVNCHASQPLFAHEPSESTLNLPLPWPEKEFDDGVLRSKLVSLGSGHSNNGVFCELIRAMTFWSRVHSLINAPESSTATRITAIHALDDQISTWWSSIDSSFQLAEKDTSNMDAIIFPKVLLINIAYHQCLCALHTSIVPLFSWSEGDYTWLSARQLSAQVAYEHAGAVSSLLGSTIARISEASSISSFVGYAAYCGCATQIPFLWCTETGVRERAQINFRTNVKMIRILAKHWKFCALLEIHAEYLYQKHAQNPVILENEPKYLDASKLNVPRIKARHARASILGHNKILWAAEIGYARRGEEVKDLGNEPEEEVPRYEYAAHKASAPTDFQYVPVTQEQAQMDQSRLPFTDQSMLDLFPLDVDYTDMPLFNLDFFNFADSGHLASGPAGPLDGLPFRV